MLNVHFSESIAFWLFFKLIKSIRYNNTYGNCQSTPHKGLFKLTLNWYYRQVVRFSSVIKWIRFNVFAADPQGGSTLILAWVAVSRAQTSFPELCKANRISTRVDLSVCMSTQFMTFCDVNRLPSIYGSLLRRLPSIYGSSTSLLRIFRTFGIDNREVIVNAHWPAVNN